LTRSSHPDCRATGKRAGNENVAYFIRSNSFVDRFGHVSDSETYSAMCSYVRPTKRGPMGEGTCLFTDVNGDAYEFYLTSFSNGYDLLTMGQLIGPYRKVIGF